MAPSTSHFLQQIRFSLKGGDAVHKPHWMQTSTTRWPSGCLSSFNSRRLCHKYSTSFNYSCHRTRSQAQLGHSSGEDSYGSSSRPPSSHQLYGVMSTSAYAGHRPLPPTAAIPPAQSHWRDLDLVIFRFKQFKSFFPEDFVLQLWCTSSVIRYYWIKK